MIVNFPRIPVHTRQIQFSGGLDTETPVMDSISGRVKRSQNLFQDVNGGYSTIKGYERFNGLPSPSSTLYTALPATVENVNVGDVISSADNEGFGIVAGVFDEVLVLVDVTGAFRVHSVGAGSYLIDGDEGLSDGINFLVDGNPGELGGLYVDGVFKGICTGTQVIGSAATPELDAIYKSMAADVYRARIEAVPGSGDVLGVYMYNDKWYAFRNNEAGTAVSMFVNSVNGWDEVDLGKELPFSAGGVYEIKEGDLIVGATSGASATVSRVVLETGDFLSGTAAGRLIFAEQTGLFEAEALNVAENLNVAVIPGNSSDITFAIPSGKFEFDVSNFTGSVATKRLYGVDGKNRGWEFDGTTFVPISTGMYPDNPSHVVEHAYHLFYAYGPSVQSSAAGFPYQWSPVVGGDEIALGDRVTGFVPQIGNISGNALCIFTRNSFGMLYGSSIEDYVLAHQRKSQAGAIEWTSQIIGNTYSLDDRGITKLSTSQDYGNFNDATVSQNIQSWLTTKKTQVTCSCVIKEKNQYWIFFADSSALCCTVDNGEIVAMMPMLFPHKVTCVCSIENENGTEEVMIGCSDGFVRRFGRGNSFDGEEITWFGELVYDNLKSPTIKKKFHKWTLEVAGEGYSKFHASYDLSYSNSFVAQPSGQLEELIFATGIWDVGDWDTGEWDGRRISPSYFKMYGTGENISLKLYGSSNYCNQLKMSGSLLQFKSTREMR